MDMGISHYSKIESGQREASVVLLDKLSNLYGITNDHNAHMCNDVPADIN